MSKITAIAGLALVLAGLAAGRPAGSPALQDRFLREDLALAKTSSLYLVMFLKSGTMSLRAGGLTLREWKLAGLRAWGNSPPLEALAIDRKSTLAPPKRVEIIPQTEEEAEKALADAEQKVEESKKADKKKDTAKPVAFELEALELKDMPTTFAFIMSDGTKIDFRPKVDKFLPRLASFGHSVSWYLWAPLQNLWARSKKRPFSAIDVKLEAPVDCQSLYWSLAEGSKVLIFPL